MTKHLAFLATLMLLLLASANVASAQFYEGCACADLQPASFYYSTTSGGGCGVNYQLCPDQPDVYFNTQGWECWDIVGDFIMECENDECLSYCAF